MKVDIDTSDKLYADAWLGFKGTDWKTKLMSAILFNITIHLMKAMNLSRRSDACHHGIVGKVMEGIRIENATHAPLISIPILPPQLPLMMQDILTSRWKK